MAPKAGKTKTNKGKGERKKKEEKGSSFFSSSHASFFFCYSILYLLPCSSANSSGHYRGNAGLHPSHAQGSTGEKNETV